MNDDAMTRLEQRIARLELANRRWRRLAACSVLILACVGMMAAQRGGNNISADQVEARKIVVRDDAGREMIILGMLDKKYPGMRIQTPGTMVNTMFFTSSDHATLAMMDNNGASSLSLNSGGATSNPDISMVKVGPGRQVKRLFRAPPQ